MESALDIAAPIVFGVNWLMFAAIMAVELFVLVHAIVQRSEAFTAAGKLTKPAWIAINLVATLFTVLFAMPGAYVPGLVYVTFGSLFGLVAITAALVYLVDVRPAIKEITEGGSSW